MSQDLRTLERAFARDPSDQEAFAALSDAYRAEGRLAELARTQETRAAHLDPTTARHLDPATGPLDDRDRALAEDWGGPVTLHEYCLVAGRTYHAVVDGETYHLPPDGSGEPVQRTNLVLVLSEHPLVEGRPVNRLIPTFAGWSY